MKPHKSTENKLLENVTLITSLGDFISKFAFIKIMTDAGYSVFVASTVVMLQAFGNPIGNTLVSILKSKMTTRSIAIGTQLLSALLSIIILVLYITNFYSLPTLSICILFLSILGDLFKAAREVHSKYVSDDDHIGTQSILLKAFYKAQFLGPIISLGLIYYLPLYIPLTIDFFTFIISAFILYRGNLTKTDLVAANPFKALVYVWKDIKLRKIFSLRTIGYWISAGPFNYLVFAVVVFNFKLSPLMTAWVYSAVGLGGTIMSELIANGLNIKKTIGDRNLSIIGHLGLSVMVFFFISVSNFYLALFFLVLYGVFMSMNAIGSQAIRRRLTDNKTFPEIIGAESILGKLTDISFSYIVYLLIERGIGEINTYMIISSILTFIVGILYFTLDNKKSEK
jgi:hypothetical protein